MVNWGSFYQFFLKSLNAEKLKERTLWDFSTSVLTQHPFCRKNIEKKVAQRRKKLKGGHLVSPGNVCYAEKLKIFFGSVPWANRCNLKFSRTFGRTILVTSGVSEKKH